MCIYIVLEKIFRMALVFKKIKLESDKTKEDKLVAKKYFFHCSLVFHE